MAIALGKAESHQLEGGNQAIVQSLTIDDPVDCKGCKVDIGRHTASIRDQQSAILCQITGNACERRLIRTPGVTVGNDEIANEQGVTGCGLHYAANESIYRIGRNDAGNTPAVAIPQTSRTRVPRTPRVPSGDDSAVGNRDEREVFD